MEETPLGKKDLEDIMAVKTHRTTVRDDFLELVQKFPLRPIRTNKQLEAAHAVIDELTRIPEEKVSSDLSDYLEVLGDLTLAYEQKQMEGETDDVTGLDILLHLMQEHEMSASALGRLLGHRELGSKIVRAERSISKANAKVLGEHFGLPAETFLR
jgi:HTH-type transcriptional regulator/antitoxin HigA